MYTPPAFREDDTHVLHELMRAARLCNFVTATAQGLMATPLPLFLDESEGECGTLYGHLARPNPQWQAPVLGEAMAIFMGPDAYVTPSWYAAKREHGKVVPTWNYVTVQVRGPARVIEDPAWLHAQLDSLTRQQEAPRDEPWNVTDAPEAFVAAQMRGIVGIEIEIASLVGKFKLSQNRQDADKLGVFNGLAADPESESQAMASLVKAHALGGTS